MIYSKALGNSSSAVYAGYFEGKVGIGSGSGNQYIFPAKRGEEGQMLVLSITGNLQWQNSNTKDYDFPQEAGRVGEISKMSGLGNLVWSHQEKKKLYFHQECTYNLSYS